MFVNILLLCTRVDMLKHSNGFRPIWPNN